MKITKQEQMRYAEKCLAVARAIKDTLHDERDVLHSPEGQEPFHVSWGMTREGVFYLFGEERYLCVSGHPGDAQYFRNWPYIVQPYPRLAAEHEHAEWVEHNCSIIELCDLAEWIEEEC